VGEARVAGHLSDQVTLVHGNSLFRSREIYQRRAYGVNAPGVADYIKRSRQVTVCRITAKNALQ
jgi:hypothetical protein